MFWINRYAQIDRKDHTIILAPRSVNKLVNILKFLKQLRESWNMSKLFPKQLSAEGVLAVLIEGPVTEGHRRTPSDCAKLL